MSIHARNVSTNATKELTDAELAEVCAGCGLRNKTHRPKCPVCVRLHAGDLYAQHGADWATTARRIHTQTLATPRAHQREVADHMGAVCAAGVVSPTPVAIVWDAAEGVFREYHTAIPFSQIKKPIERPEWWGQT